MDVGFETIGNATLICYDTVPVLVTDPWLVGSPYFGSWGLSHEIPEQQMEAIKQCQYVWISHGHPDHLSIASLNLLKDKKILLADHVGGRIEGDLRRLGFNVSVLKDRVWNNLSSRINVLCVCDYNQDAILLVDVNGTLLLDLNDTGPRGWGPFVKKTLRNYKESILLQLFGYGDTDMINLFDEDGVRVEPRAALKLPVGQTIAQVAEAFGVSHVVPFSSLHRYQRADSVWANQHATPLEDYAIGFSSRSCELLPAFIRYDCLQKNFTEIKPAESPAVVLDPKEFGDDWSEPLKKGEFKKVEEYFQQISHLPQIMDFINIRVGDEDNIIDLRGSNFKKGIIFEVPRRSLMRAIRYEIFDDLLIGNFMKTSLVGKWPKSTLYPDFTPYVTKYADNGRAKTEEELRNYFRAYRQRAPVEYLRHRIQNRVASVARARLDDHSQVYRLAKRAYWFANKHLGG